jgi:DNA-binding transcriptional LysR family regulator
MRISAQTNSLRVQKQLVAAGRGWTVLPGVGIAEDVTEGTLSAAPVRAPDIWRSIVLGTPRHARVPPAAEVVARELVRLVTAAATEGRWPSAELQAARSLPGVS